MHIVYYTLSLPGMTQAAQLKSHLVAGHVYRRNDLEEWSNAVDRHLLELQEDGTLQKVAPGLYYYPKISAFGKTPPDDKELIRAFLKDDRFLLTSPNDYNKLGLGTTQLYNKVIVYNHKRHGEFKLGNRHFSFQRKPHFPEKVTTEFLLVDMINNLENLAEDEAAIVERLKRKVSQIDSKSLTAAIKLYGSTKTKKLFNSVIRESK